MVKDHSHCQDAQMIFRYLKKLKNKSSKKTYYLNLKKCTCQNDDEHLNIHYIYILHQDHQFLSSYHWGPHLKVPSSCQSCTVPSMEPSTKRCQVWLDRWCLRCPFGISIHNTFDVTLIHQNVYIRKKTSLAFCQILWARWKMARYILVPGQNMSEYQTNLWSLTYSRVAETQAAAKTHSELV